MESITKNRQSPEVLRAMVERAYGSGQVPDGDGWFSELGHGWFNVAYEITLRDGARVVVKIAPPPGVEVMTYERCAMDIEMASLRLIAEQTSVPVPRVDFHDATRDLVDADYFFMPFVEADNFGIVAERLTPAEVAEYDAQLGALNRELNSITGPGFGPLAGPHQASWRSVFTGLMDEVFADGERRAVDLGWDYQLVRDTFAEHAHVLDEVTEPRFVEWDLWNSNAMIRDGRIVCIIDHERALYGDPLFEAGFTATQLPAFGDSTAFMKGYGHPPLTPTQTTRRQLYCLHLSLIMVIETVYRGHTDTVQYDWARARLTETMALLGHGGR